MSSSESARQILIFTAAFFIFITCRSTAAAQPAQGFAVERFYPSAPGGGWFIMDDLNISGGLGGAIAFTSGYSRNPLEVTSSTGERRLSLVSNQVFIDVGVAGTYNRYRVYFNFPMPLLVKGSSGTPGPDPLTAPAVDVGANPDTISDPRIGFDMRLFGEPGSSVRLGMGAQLLIPSGERADYVTDGTYRGMFRFLAAGDTGRFSYAGQLGVHIRTLNNSPVPSGPNGSELLFGGSAGRRMSVHDRWTVIVGPEIFGETAFHSFFNNEQTGVEGLLTSRFERTGDRPHLRLKVGIGHGLVQHFGAPEWRIVFGAELFGQR